MYTSGNSLNIRLEEHIFADWGTAPNILWLGVMKLYFVLFKEPLLLAYVLKGIQVQ